MQEFPEYYGIVVKQWKQTNNNWIFFHNQFTEENITNILSMREFHIALQVVNHVPYTAIAEQYNISIGRLKNIMSEIYDKLIITKRDELAEYVLPKSKMIAEHTLRGDLI